MRATFINSWLTAGGVTSHTNLTWRTTQTSTADASSYTFSSQAIGTAAADRWVIVGVVTDFAPSSVTVGGVSATQIATDGANDRATIWAVNVTSGTVADIVVTISAENCQIGYWTVNMPSGTPTDTSSSGNDFDTTATCTGVDIPANGFAIAISWGASVSDQSHSIDASFTEQAETFAETNAAFSHRETVSVVTGATVISTWSAVGGSGCTMAIAAWQ